MSLRYSGEFLSTRNVRWRVDIYQRSETPFASVGELRFPADSPLKIEWKHTDKEEVVCGSTATLTLLSPGDRTYEDLYTIRPGDIRLEVFRNDALYWSGTLDPEFYEEPYAYFSQYEVTLTFSDFGILDRYNFDLSGIRSLQYVLEYALHTSGIRYNTINQQYITTSFTSGGAPLTLNDLSVYSDNFYDEDGEPSTLYEVLEGILQPLGLRMQQKNGTVWVYDLNGLYTLCTHRVVEWTDADQMMGTDKVVNNAKITFSPYAKAEMIASELAYEDKYAEEMTNLGNNPVGGGTAEYYSYYPDYDANWDYQDLSFTLFCSNKGSGLAQKSSGSRYFRIQPLLGGTEAEGLAYSFYTGGHGDLRSGRPRRKLGNPSAKTPTVLMRTKRTPVQLLDAIERNRYFLRLRMDMMLDMRYNPFTQAARMNEEGNQGTADYRFNYVQVPATVTLYDETGKALMHYTNSSITRRTDLRGALSTATLGEWKEGPAPYQSCWLEWYNPQDRHKSSGILGWKTNRHNIGTSLQDIYESFKKLDSGQYIPYPPQGGYVEVCIYTGVWIYEWTKGKVKEAPQEWYDMIRWMLYKAPVLEMVRRNITHSAAENEDIEYNGIINENAKDDLKLDTVCGTSATVIPSAKGIYLRTSTGLAVKTLSRGHRTTQAEQLLIGTLYSQYADRKTKLSGTTRLVDDNLCGYLEPCQPTKQFICLSEVQNAIADESDMEFVELRPDEYKADTE